MWILFINMEIFWNLMLNIIEQDWLKASSLLVSKGSIKLHQILDMVLNNMGKKLYKENYSK
jgi:hypothetical protein